jgi:hypothetical protein
MKSQLILLCGLVLASGSNRLFANVLSSQMGGPFGVQPGAGLIVTGGVTQGFFSDLSGLPFPGPGIVDVLSNLLAYDDLGDSIANFQVTDAIVMQGSSMITVPVETFTAPAPTTYASYLDPLNQVIVDPANINLSFLFDTDSSFQYTYELEVTGIPDGGFLLYDDVEGAQITAAPEPSPALLLLGGLVLMVCSRWLRIHSRDRGARAGGAAR